MTSAFSFFDPVLAGPVRPVREPPPLVNEARHAGLSAFAAFLASLEFRIPGAQANEVIRFKVKRENIFTEQPDHDVVMGFPSIAVNPGRGRYDIFALGAASVFDETYGKFSPGTVLAKSGEYIETLGLEVWATKRAERRALVAGIELAMLGREFTTALRLVLPKLFNLTGVFTPDQREIVDDAESARDRRRAHIYVQMIVPIVQLVSAVTLRPETVVEVDESCEP